MNQGEREEALVHLRKAASLLSAEGGDGTPIRDSRTPRSGRVRPGRRRNRLTVQGLNLEGEEDAVGTPKASLRLQLATDMMECGGIDDATSLFTQVGSSFLAFSFPREGFLFLFFLSDDNGASSSSGSLGTST